MKDNPTKNISTTVTCKSIQYCYKRLQGRFDKSDKSESIMSRIGGEIRKSEELLVEMKEGRFYKERKSNHKIGTADNREKGKE